MSELPSDDTTAREPTAASSSGPVVEEAIDAADDGEEVEVEEATEEPAEAAPRRRPTPPPPQAPPRPPMAPPSSPSVSSTHVEISSAASLATLAAEGWSERVALLEKELLLENDKERRALLEYEIGELFEGPGQDEAGAVKRYSAALATDPSLRPNVWALRRICRRHEQWPDLLNLIETEARVARDDEERAELLVERGILLADKMNDAAGARDSFEQAVALAPTSLPALMALEKIAVSDGDVAALASIYRKATDAAAEPQRKVALLLDLARLAENVAGLAADEAAGEALALLREAHSFGALRPRVLEEMERVAEAAGKVEELVAVLELRATYLEGRRQAAPGEVRFVEELVALRRRQAQLVQSTDGARAWTYLEQAAACLPDEPLLIADLADVAADLGLHADLADLLGRRAAPSDGAPPPAPLVRSLKLAQARALRRAGKEPEALAVEAEVDAAWPGWWPLLHQRQLRSLLAGDVEQLASHLKAEGELAAAGKTPLGDGVADPIWAANALTLAGSADVRRGADAAATAAFERAVAISPGFRPAIDALDRAHAHAGRAAERARLLEGELAGAAPGRAEYLLEELVVLKLEKLSDVDGALAAADALCALKDGDLRARTRLVEICQETGRWAEAAGHLEKLAEKLTAQGAVERAAEVMVERARIVEKRLGDSATAATLHDVVSRTLPSHVEATAALKRLHAGAGRHAEVAKVLEREIEATLDPARVADLLVELGELFERDLGRPDEAARVYRDLLDRSPGHPVALRALARAYDRAGDAGGLAQVTEAAAEAATGPEAQALELLTLGEVYEDRLHHVDLAEDAFGRSLEKAPSAHAAFGRLRALARRRDHAQLDGAVARLAETATGAAVAALAEERAWLAAGPGDDLDAAEARMEAAGEATVPQLELQRARVFARRADGAQLGAALARIHSVDAELRGALALRAAAFATTTGGDGSELARLALREAGSDSNVLVGACDLVVDTDALVRRAELADGVAAIELRLERIEALETAGRFSTAATEAQALLAAAPDHLGLLTALRRIAAAGGDKRGQARVTARIASILLDPEPAAFAWLAAARLFDDAGDAIDAAICWRHVLASHPLDAEAYRRAHALALAAVDPGSHEALLSDRLSVVESVAQKVELLVERAELRRSVGRPRAAMDDYRAVLDLDPQHLAALAAVADLAADDGDVATAIALFDRFTEACNDATQLRSVHLRLADLHTLEGEPLLTIRSLQLALEIQPDDPTTIERLADTCLAQGDHNGGVTQLRTLARLTSDRAERVRVERRVAEVYQEGLRDGRGAREAYARALEEDPTDLEILGKLLPLCDAQGEIQLRRGVVDRALAEVRTRIAAAPQKAEPHQAMVQLLAWKGDEDGRVFALQAAALASAQQPEPRASPEPPRELSAAAMERVSPAEARGLALEVWREAHEASQKLYGPELPSLGVGKNDRQNGKGVPLAWIPVDKIVRALCGGTVAYELYSSGAMARDLCVTVGPALVLGPGHADRLTPSARFRVARKVVLLRDRLGPLDTLDDDELELFFAACARVGGGEWHGSRRLAEPRIEERTKQVNKILDRRARKALQALVPRLGGLGDVLAWRRAVLLGAARLALVVAGDLAAALGELKVGLGDEIGGGLALFATSDDMVAVRRDLGLRS